MPIHIVVVAWTAENRLAKYQDYLTETEALAHVARVADDFPDAFTALHPGGGPGDWLIDPVAKMLALDPLPPPLIVVPPPTETAILRDALMTKTVITQADLDAAKTKLTT